MSIEHKGAMIASSSCPPGSQVAHRRGRTGESHRSIALSLRKRVGVRGLDFERQLLAPRFDPSLPPNRPPSLRVN
jgi:hypothetical protein